MHCLRLDDELMDLYRSFNAMRNWDRFEFESLGLALDALPGGKIPREELRQLKTVEDVIRTVSAGRAGRGESMSVR